MVAEPVVQAAVAEAKADDNLAFLYVGVGDRYSGFIFSVGICC